MSKGDFARLLMGGVQAQSGADKISGNSQKVSELLALLDTFDPMFNVVTP
jgi:alkyl sulfatase BDS1-like metallo-beta-lactamase superfamily hydrolase